jgi:hypothetical protein
MAVSLLLYVILGLQSYDPRTMIASMTMTYVPPGQELGPFDRHKHWSMHEAIDNAESIIIVQRKVAKHMQLPRNRGKAAEK